MRPSNLTTGFFFLSRSVEQAAIKTKAKTSYDENESGNKLLSLGDNHIIFLKIQQENKRAV